MLNLCAIGQACTAGSRIFVQEGIYDTFMAKFTAIAQALTQKAGDPFTPGTMHGPQVSQTQFDVCLSSSCLIASDSLLPESHVLHLNRKGGGRYAPSRW